MVTLATSASAILHHTPVTPIKCGRIISIGIRNSNCLVNEIIIETRGRLIVWKKDTATIWLATNGKVQSPMVNAFTPISIICVSVVKIDIRSPVKRAMNP
jgi:hypothetical protein